MISDESKLFHYSVYSVVGKIPYGKTTSYGHIAYLIGKPKNSRQVGSAMKNYNIILPLLNDSSLNNQELQEISNIPWWRVVSSSGKISPRTDSNSEINQLRILTEEGILANNRTIVDFNEFGWFPDDVDIS